MAGITGLQGDIIRADLKEIPYIECKKYADFRLENFLTKQGDEWGWMKQTLKNAGDRVWVIIFCKDYGRNDWLVTNATPALSIEGFLATALPCYLITTFDFAFKNEDFKKLFIY